MWLEVTEVIKVDHSVSPKILGQRKGPVCQAGEQKNNTGRLGLFVLPSDAGRDSSVCHLDIFRCDAPVWDLGWIAYAGPMNKQAHRTPSRSEQKDVESGAASGAGLQTLVNQ